MRTLLVILALLVPVEAQSLDYDSAATETCLESGTDARNCIGESANACMGTPDGSTTVGMGFCLSQELSLWDARLNTAYRTLMQVERRLDDDVSDLGGNVPPRASALRDMQRAWITYRDATCVYEYAQWGGGSGGGPAHAACLMRITAEQALALEGRLEDHQR